MKKFSTLLLLFLLNLVALQNLNAQVIWDSSFNGYGTTTRLYYDGSPSVAPIGINAAMHLLTGSGRIIAAGTVAGYYSGYGFGYLANGSMDPSFGTSDMLNIPVSNGNMRMVASAGDTIFVLGEGVDWSSGDEFITVTKMDTFGNFASDFGTGGQIQVPILFGGYNYGCSPCAIAIQADGKIVVAANANIVFATSEILRFMPNGAADPTFGTGGVVPIMIASCGYNVNSIFPLPGNKILVTGDFRHDGSTENFSAIRFLNNGNYDSSFADSGYIYNYVDFAGAVYASCLQPDGKVIVGGTGAIRYTTDGAVDTTFGSGGVYYPPIIISAMQQDNLGRTYLLGSNGANNLIRIKPNGGIDSTFNATGIFSFGFGSAVNDTRSLSIYPEGKILMYGDYRDADYNYHLFLARVDILPVIENTGAPPPYCTGDIVDLYCHAIGSVRWYNGTALLADTGKEITVTTGGSYTAVATLGGYADTSVATIITFNPLPDAGIITGLSTVCLGATITLTDGATGGAWSVANTNANVAGGIVTGVTGGADTISYSVTNSCGTAVATTDITINLAPSVAAIGGSSTVCTGATITISDATAGGAWNAANTNATITGTTVTGVTTGTDLVSYSVTNSCGTTTETQLVTVNAAPTTAGTITGNDTVCTGSTITLSDGTTGGVWTTGNTNVSVTGGIVTGETAGADSVVYTISNTCGSVHTAKYIHIRVCPTGVDEITSGITDLKVYPNPATDELVVENAGIGSTIKLFNMPGQQVYSNIINGSKQVIDMRSLTPGTYIIQLTDTNGNRMNKTVVKPPNP